MVCMCVFVCVVLFYMVRKPLSFESKFVFIAEHSTNSYKTKSFVLVNKYQ
jgi:hypothetical protein